MKTMKQHNAERMAAAERMNRAHEPHPNGIQCGECGKELWDSNPMTLLTSNPPQKNVHCPSCGWRGFRLA